MKKLLKTGQNKFLTIAQGIFYGMLVTIGPVALINHRQLPMFLQHLDWPMAIFFSLSIMQGIIACFGKNITSTNSFKLLLVLFYITCYTACCALCQKLSWTLLFAPSNNQINSSSCDFPWPIIILSWVLICLSAGIQLIIILKKARHINTNEANPNKINTEYNLIASKEAFQLSWLLYMAGVSLNFDVWLPLIALPGIWVALNWLD